MLWGLFKNNKVKEKKFIIALILGIFIGFFLFLLINYYPADKNIVFGATFSKKYAQELGLDWQKIYLNILDDLRVKKIRLPVYWDDVEKELGKYDFEPYDWMVREAEKRNVKVILNLGIKLPRWPECHIPNWALSRTNAGGTRTDAGKIEDLFLPFLRKATERYKNYSNIWTIQVENEPYFYRSFGICPEMTANLDEEIKLVKEIVNVPIISTESGELGHWERMIGRADILGISLYRTTWNKWVGYFFYPLTPFFYREKIRLIKPFFEDVLITELQVEPWSSKSIFQTSLEEQLKTMSLSQFRSNIDFARRAGSREVYLWGVEWWDYMREKHGDERFWEEGKKLFE